MKWYNKCKFIVNKLVLTCSAIMGFILLTGKGLLGATGIHKYGEINYFVENYYVPSVYKTHNYFFGALIVLGALIMIFGWKSFDGKNRDGIWLENMSIGFLATAFVGYGLTTQLTLHVMCWSVITAYIMGALLLVLFVINLIYFTKHKEIRSEHTGMKKVLLGVIVTVVFTVAGGIYYGRDIDDKWDEKYLEFCEIYEGEIWGLLRDDHALIYNRLQFVNYFNQDGKSFTIEELEESIANFKNKEGSWYTLWYCIEFLNDVFAFRETPVSFSDYDYNGNPAKGFWVYTCRYLILKDIDVDTASDEQLDEACRYVYECITNQVPIELVGEEEELVFHISIPKSGDESDVSVIVDSDKFYPSTMLWYEAGSVGERFQSGSEPVDVIREGTMYRVQLEAYCGMPYAFSKDAKVAINGVEYEELEVEVEHDNLTVYIWLTPSGIN